MKKTFILTLLFIVLVSHIPLPQSVLAEEDHLERRNVTMIYDDSGSMWYTTDPQTGERLPSDNWKLANYALQSLTALLGENDLLHVVRMSEEHNVNELGLSYNERQGEINRVFNWEESGWTPFDTVHTSLSNMRKNMEQYPNDDYWFIIVMDGAFNDLDYLITTDETELEENYRKAYETLQDFKNEVEQKDVSFQSIFVTMESFLTEDEVIQMARFKEEVWDRTLAGENLRAETEQEIIDRINEVAAIMTNRDPQAEQTNVTLNPQIRGKEVTLQSPYPLKRITVIQQQSGENVTHELNKFTVNGSEGEYAMNGPYQIESPYDPYELRETIYGAVSHVGHDQVEGVIPEGTYTLTFSEEIDLEDYQFIAEPAIDFEVSVKRVEDNGDLNPDPNTFFYGTEMKLLVRFTERGGTGEPFSFTSQDATANVEVTANIDGEDMILEWEPALQAFTSPFIMPEDPTKANVKSYIQGFYQEEKEHPIIGVPKRTWELNKNHGVWEYGIDEIEDSAPLSFTPYINGEPITEVELANIFESIEVNVSGGSLDVEWEQDGSSILIHVNPPRFPFLLSSGEREIEVTVYGPYAEETAVSSDTIEVTDIPFMQKYGIYILYLLGILLLLIYVIGIFKKDRFDRQSSYMESERTQIISGRRLPSTKTTILFRTSFFKRWFVPYTPEKINIDGLTFKAASTKDRILLAKESQQPEMRIGRRLLKDQAGQKDHAIYTNDPITREFGHTEETYRYYRR
ncbi:hypothetical protein [Evansella tamaricis]|uniref:VWFA domain-containing protein n=1 Tax=Evansella tamaricis TaxID=2069301 RepID=A0ABS6JL23_9BACI|nr:hypothetical protein [Evansella tamaricis]MBU9714377.1 hypothetical protein [Evansella tamaricis]